MKIENDAARAPFRLVDLASLEGTPCPCGTSHRAFASEGAGAFSLHLVEISKDSRVHYHRKLTELYYFLSGEGQLELDGSVYAVRPGMAVLIPPGVRHRAIPGRDAMKVLNFVMPAFDPADEWFDGDGK
jgi:mannose-6-phosphate isomerase-like protein (cupin superfamily)